MNTLREGPVDPSYDGEGTVALTTLKKVNPFKSKAGPKKRLVITNLVLYLITIYYIIICKFNFQVY